MSCSWLAWAAVASTALATRSTHAAGSPHWPSRRRTHLALAFSSSPGWASYTTSWAHAASVRRGPVRGGQAQVVSQVLAVHEDGPDVLGGVVMAVRFTVAPLQLRARSGGSFGLAAQPDDGFGPGYGQ